MSDELLLRGGPVYTFDGDRTVVDAVLFRDGRVAALGEAAEAGAGSGDGRSGATDTSVVELDGRPVVPGFVDAHAHLLSVGVDELEADLSGASSRDEALDRLREEARTRPEGTWVVGHNYDASGWADGRALDREDLDPVSEDHPVAAFQVTGHEAGVNSRGLAALDLAGLERDVRTADGEPTGVLVEDAVGQVKKATFPRGERAREALRLAGERALALGVTSVQHVSGLTAPADRGSPIHRAFFDAWRENDLPVRVTFYVHSGKGDALANLEIASGFGDDWLRVGGLKTFSDGALGPRTAKLSHPYPGEPENDGTWTTDPDELGRLFGGAARANQQVATHALGDRAVDEVLDRYEAVLPQYPRDPRLRIEHLELATDAALERMADLGVVASMQPNFLQWAGDGGVYESVLGQGARGGNNRFRDVLDAGVTLAFGSDSMPMGPMYGIHHAVNAPHESQRLTVEEAIAAYTRGAAYAGFAEDEVGSLERGTLGDAVVLGSDPFDDPAGIADVTVDLTVLGGRSAYERDGAT